MRCVVAGLTHNRSAFDVWSQVTARVGLFSVMTTVRTVVFTLHISYGSSVYTTYQLSSNVYTTYQSRQ